MKPKPFWPFEEFYDAGAFTDDLGGHPATRAAAAATATEAAATATVAKAAAAAETATITETAAIAETATITEAAAETSTLFGETAKSSPPKPSRLSLPRPRRPLSKLMP
jgi:hypothetical protein